MVEGKSWVRAGITQPGHMCAAWDPAALLQAPRDWRGRISRAALSGRGAGGPRVGDTHLEQHSTRRRKKECLAGERRALRAQRRAKKTEIRRGQTTKTTPQSTASRGVAHGTPGVPKSFGGPRVLSYFHDSTLLPRADVCTTVGNTLHRSRRRDHSRITSCVTARSGLNKENAVSPSPPSTEQ